MKAVSEVHKEYLQTTFGSRVNFDRLERKLYGHDVGDMPRLIKPLVGDTTPDAIVQPESEAELIALVNWARENNIPLTPRGMATSGYGGVLPVRRGLIVDFYRMKKIIGIDSENLTVTTMPGIIWEDLDNALAKQGLALKLYPTSYPSSTVGGWLAQGGAGIGSYEAGWFRNSVISARVVLPDGSTAEFSGDELDLISDAEGITGLITSVTMKVMPAEELLVTSIAVEETDGVQKLAEAVLEAQLPLWSFLFINPSMAEFKNRTPLREHLGHVVEERVELPQTYVATLTYRKRDTEKITAKLDSIIKSVHGVRLDDHIAAHEWDNRFRIMKVKRLGPSLVPAEFVLPVSSLAAAFDEITGKISQPIVKEGIIVRSDNGAPQVVILGFIPADQRKFNYHFVFSLSLSITHIAEKHGGRAYATGLYFTGKGESIFGKERLARLSEYKKKIDPSGFMNPGKVISKNIVSRAIGLASAIEPVTRFFGNSSKTRAGELDGIDLKGIPADVAWHAYSCSQCGFCVNTCDQLYGRGWESQSPRGKWYFLRELMEGREKWDQKSVDTFLVCTTCERCNLRCPEALPIEPSWMKLRGKLIHEGKRMTFPPFEMMDAALRNQGNIWAGYRKDRTAWFPEDLKEKHGPGKKGKAVYFAGCTASYVEHDIGMATARLLDAAGVDFVHLGNDENCCGTPMLVAGKWDTFEKVMRENVQLVKNAGADTVICSCPACDMMWRHSYKEWADKLGIDYDIKVRHYTEVISEKIANGEFSFPENGGKDKETVTWHDSCHAGRVSEIYEPPRELIKANPNADFVEMESNRDSAKCCGSVLTLIKEPEVAAYIGKDRLDEAVDVGAKKVLAMCPCCQFQLRVAADKKQVPVEVVDLARYSAEALGYDLPDPNPEVRKQWAVFEAMIELMTPKGFAGLMDTMWPELIDAMPLGMGPMMRLFGKVPGVLNLMKPAFPVLFPILLPRMMPKLLPTMLDRIGKMIPMPDYMAEQMPGMMPGIMDNLMPHMIGDVVPLVTQPMIDYLQGKKKTA